MLETQRLKIREFTLLDTKIIYEFSQEESLKKWLPDQVYADMDEAKETLEFLISKYREKEVPFVMAVVEKDSNELVGHVGLSEIKQGIEIGYAVGEKYQNKGYASEAVNAYAAWAKKEFCLEKVYGVVKSENYASCMVLERSGLTYVKDDIEGEFDRKALRKIYIK
jgi:ribosomal-protein-alanine N-acetyltransferase